MKTVIPIFSALCLVLCVQVLNAANFSSFATGNWNAAGTWTLTSGMDVDGIPDADDNVTISFNHIITLDIAPTIASLTMLSNSLITGANSFTISGNTTISGAALSPDGAVSIGGALAWENGDIGVLTSASVFDVTVGGTVTITHIGLAYGHGLIRRKLIINGGCNWTDGSLTFGGGAIFEVPIGQTFTYNQTTGFTISNIDAQSGTLDIKGTLLKQGNFSLGINNVTVINSGAINVTGGTLNIFPTNYSGNGSISCSTGATFNNNYSGGLNYSNAAFTNNGTYSGSALIFNGSTQQTLAGTGTIANLTLNNANNLNITGTQTISDRKSVV